jgi:two-component system, LytTR family, response regulator
MSIRALIADDEPLARDRIRRFLAKDPEIEVVAECGDGAAAVAAIRREAPDLVFLDVQMPEMDGFEVVRRVGAKRMPVTIFVTAYDTYAIRAFDAQALDYLLKPIGAERFAQAVGRAKEQLIGALNRRALRGVLATLRKAENRERYPTRWPVSRGDRVTFVDTLSIDWIEAAGNYVRVHAGNDVHTLRETLTQVKRRLDPAVFVRIHRSTIVNVRSIREIQRWFHGHHLIILKTGEELRMSRYQSDVARHLGIGRK